MEGNDLLTTGEAALHAAGYLVGGVIASLLAWQNLFKGKMPDFRRASDKAGVDMLARYQEMLEAERAARVSDAEHHAARCQAYEDHIGRQDERIRQTESERNEAIRSLGLMEGRIQALEAQVRELSRILARAEEQRDELLQRKPA